LLHSALTAQGARNLKDEQQGHEEFVTHSSPGQFSPRTILAGTAIASSLPFLMVMLFPAQLHFVMSSISYLLFQILQSSSASWSVSPFSGRMAHIQPVERPPRAFFSAPPSSRSGLMDFMHTLASAAMPAFVTLNTTNKSAQFWTAARLVSAVAFLASAYVYKDGRTGWLPKAALSRTVLMTAASPFPHSFLSGSPSIRPSYPTPSSWAWGSRPLRFTPSI